MTDKVIRDNKEALLTIIELRGDCQKVVIMCSECKCPLYSLRKKYNCKAWAEFEASHTLSKEARNDYTYQVCLKAYMKKYNNVSELVEVLL